MNQSTNFIHTIAVHCSATPKGMDIGAKEIRRWHVNDNKWADIGYHFIIRRNGNREFGRAITTTGAHVRGYNHGSIGICLIGGVDAKGQAVDNFTKAQKGTLKNIIIGLRWVLPEIKVIQGHRDFPNVKKDCPSFDVATLLKEYKIAI